VQLIQQCNNTVKLVTDDSRVDISPFDRCLHDGGHVEKEDMIFFCWASSRPIQTSIALMLHRPTVMSITWLDILFTQSTYQQDSTYTSSASGIVYM